jgi:hypothetical protein
MLVTTSRLYCVFGSLPGSTWFVEAFRRRRDTVPAAGQRRTTLSAVLVSQTFASWNRVVPWLRAVDELRRAA